MMWVPYAQGRFCPALPRSVQLLCYRGSKQGWMVQKGNPAPVVGKMLPASNPSTQLFTGVLLGQPQSQLEGLGLCCAVMVSAQSVERSGLANAGHAKIFSTPDLFTPAGESGRPGRTTAFDPHIFVLSFSLSRNHFTDSGRLLRVQIRICTLIGGLRQLRIIVAERSVSRAGTPS